MNGLISKIAVLLGYTLVYAAVVGGTYPGFARDPALGIIADAYTNTNGGSGNSGNSGSGATTTTPGAPSGTPSTNKNTQHIAGHSIIQNKSGIWEWIHGQWEKAQSVSLGPTTSVLP